MYCFLYVNCYICINITNKNFFMAKVISLINQKGGVGKTAITVHLGAFLSTKGFKTLIIDLDPQCDSSRSLGAYDENYTAYEFLTNSNDEISLFNHTTNENLFVLVGNRKIKELTYHKNMIHDKMKIFNDYFDFILIDCNPHLIEFNRTTLNEVILLNSDFLIIPTETDPNSIEDTNLFIPDVLKIKERNNNSLVLLGVLFSKVEVNTKLFKNQFDAFQKDASEIVFSSYIRKDEKLKHCQLKSKTIFEYDQKANACFDFQKFGEEVLEKLKKYE